MVLLIFIIVIVCLMAAACFSIVAESGWLKSEQAALASAMTAAKQGIAGVDEIASVGAIPLRARVIASLRNAEAAVTMGHLPGMDRFPYIPEHGRERWLLTIRNASITCMLIFGLAGTFLKLTTLVPAGTLHGLLVADIGGSSERLADFLKGMEGGLSSAFFPSICAIISMIVVLSLRHSLIEGCRQKLTRDFHDFCLATFAKAIHESRDVTAAAATTAGVFQQAAVAIRASSDILRDSVDLVKQQIADLNKAAVGLRKSVETIKTVLGENSPLVESIGRLYDMAAPLDDRYLRIAEHLAVIETSLAEHNGKVARTFKGVLDLAEAAKDSLPSLGRAVASTFGPVSDSAREWLSAGQRWEAALTKAMPAESKRIEEIARSLAEPTTRMRPILKQLEELLRKNEERNDGSARNAGETLASLRRIEDLLAASASREMQGFGIPKLDGVLAELAGIRATLEKNILQRQPYSANVTPMVSIHGADSSGRNNRIVPGARQSPGSLHEIPDLAAPISPAEIKGPVQFPPPSGHSAPSAQTPLKPRDAPKKGFLKRLFGRD